MNALVCAIPTMRISTVVLGKAVRNAGISGRHVITKGMRKIQSIGQNIERWERDEVQIPGTKIALERAILDALYPTPPFYQQAYVRSTAHDLLELGYNIGRSNE